MDFNTILFGGIAILSFLIFFNLGILIKVIIDDKSVVVIKGIVKVLFLK